MKNYSLNGLTLGLMVLCALLAGALLAMALRDPAPSAFAQSGMLAPSGATIALIGPEKYDRVPLFLVDTRAQSIVTYEWNLGSRVLLLRGVRTYSSDRELEEASWTVNVNAGPSVKEVRDLVKKQTLGGGPK
jgi:hypothetical protein